MVIEAIQTGYKQTEIGEIPEDWEAEEFGKNLDIFAGFGFKKSEYSKHGIKLLRIDNVSHGYIIWETIAFLPKEYLRKYPQLVLEGQDILLALNRPITNDKLKIAILLDKDSPCILYQRVGKIIQKNNKTDKMYIFYILNKFIKKFVEESSVGSDQPFISTVKLKKYLIPVPKDPKEQHLIAQVLSETDELIQQLDKLISKKKNIKKGAMQELLTGKKRLPGFKGEWEVKKLGDILTYEQPVNYIVNNSEYAEAHDVPVLTANKAFILGYTDETEGIFQNVPAIIFDDFTLDNKYVNFPFKVKSSAIKILKVKDGKSDLRFIFGIMQLIKYPIGDHKRYYISEYQNIEIKVPEKKEQTAIAQILSDMDLDIEELEQKRNKYKMIKNGMMQQLLTGRIRLKWK